MRAFEEARFFFESVVDKVGQAYTFLGEGDVLLILGEYSLALTRFRVWDRLQVSRSLPT